MIKFITFFEIYGVALGVEVSAGVSVAGTEVGRTPVGVATVAVAASP